MAHTLTGSTRTCNACGYVASEPAELWFHWQDSEWIDSLHDNGPAYTADTAPLFTVRPRGGVVEVSGRGGAFTVYWVTATFERGSGVYPSLAAALDRVAGLARKFER